MINAGSEAQTIAVGRQLGSVGSEGISDLDTTMIEADAVDLELPIGHGTTAATSQQEVSIM